jgi:ATP-binding cassette subfamily C (CFTR/MRP) protein 1
MFQALTLSPASRRNATVGEIVNLMSVDTQKCQDICAFINYIWSAPIVVIVSIVVLWQILGPATLAGVGFLFVFLPISSTIIAKKIREFQVFIFHMFILSYVY